MITSNPTSLINFVGKKYIFQAELLICATPTIILFHTITDLLTLPDDNDRVGDECLLKASRRRETGSKSAKSHRERATFFLCKHRAFLTLGNMSRDVLFYVVRWSAKEG